MADKSRSKRTTAAAIVAGPIKDRWAVPKEDIVEGERDINKRKGLQTDKLMAIIQSNADRINDSQGIKELLPDLNLVGEILVASILSPKDLRDVKLKIKTGNDTVPAMAEIIRQHLTSAFNLEGRLSEILSEALFDVGSHTLMPLPPSTIHNLIKQNTYNLESFDVNALDSVGERNLGIIADTTATGQSFAMESLSAEIFQHESPTDKVDRGLFNITDNALLLLKPTMIDAFNYNKKSQVLENAFGLEGVAPLQLSGSEISPYIKRRYRLVKELILRRDENIQVEKDGDKSEMLEAFNELNPVVLNIPSEAVIPVHVPSEPQRHIGYYIAVDRKGNPIQKSKDANYFNELNRRLKEAVMKKGESNYITNALGYTVNDQDKEIDPIIEAYERKLEEELTKAVSNGVHGDMVELSCPNDFYRTMFSRQLRRMKTSFVYVPAEMLTYFAFNYNAAGLGISLIEKTKLYASLRAIMMFANVMAGVKNSVGRRILNITLDESDPDPQLTVETVLNEFAALQTSSLPLGKLSPADIVESLQRAGIQVKVDGGEVFPTTTLDLEERQRDVGKPDPELDAQLKIMHYAGLGINPEAIDKSLQGDFATGLAQADLLQAKRIMVWQRKFTNDLSDFVRKYINAGGPLYKEIEEAYNAVEGTKPTLQEIIETIEVELPIPDTAMISSQAESFERYSAFIDNAVGLYVNEEMIGDMVKGEEVGNVIANIRASVSSHLKRQYMRKQNMLPELDKLFSDEDANPAVAINQLNAAVITVTAEIMKKFIKDEKRADKRVIKVLERLQEDDTAGDELGGGTPAGDDTGVPAEGDTVVEEEPLDAGGDTGGDIDTGLDEEPLA